MSYCVNCGVELETGSKKCPLCNTAVYHPTEKSLPEQSPAFSSRVVLPPKARKRFAAYLVSMIMLIPNIVCLLTNFLFFRGADWSIYIAATTALVWVLFVFPFYTKKVYPYLLWGFDSLAVSAYVFVFFAMDDSYLWYLRCALPVIGSFALFSLIYIMWVRRKKRQKTQKTIHLLADAVICSNVIGMELGYYYKSTVPTHVCAIIAASVIAVLLFLFYCNRSERMRAWLSRNFFTE